MATVGAPCDSAHVAHQLGSELALIESEGEASVLLGGRRFTVKRSLVEDLVAQRQGKPIRDLGRPLLVLHAPDDATVNVDISKRRGTPSHLWRWTARINCSTAQKTHALLRV